MTAVRINTDPYTRTFIDDLRQSLEDALSSRPAWAADIPAKVAAAVLEPLQKRFDLIDERLAAVQTRLFDTEKKHEAEIKSLLLKFPPLEDAAAFVRQLPRKSDMDQLSNGVAQSRNDVSVAKAAVVKAADGIGKASENIRLSLQTLSQTPSRDDLAHVGGHIANELAQLRAMVQQLQESQAALYAEIAAQNTALAHMGRPWYKKLLGG
ncbi:MAG TPA: hypothetical protein PLI95_13295 [Polyangiaceae bacterium]|nr:hypothetical protein [Polyangiaceae bacterium]